ncbi:hypothetical protein I302_106007 [Kwoniella bestiolae CBS 10118]|uniref:SUZ domain-containing protein n=1 Tax=Kwoniella bestiolae CBS 10118 TaxID=1296100 RepID=A0A1B9G2S2_9TREE|nr:hypothetical protein I302_05131 [Kwoniella bestiolae CBS 10118]OCF25316.1 hypothetical protein I302_05131 [Kwoniella bestiolae CBS 10118]
MQPHPPNVSSPTLATPRPSSLNLKPQHRENGVSIGEVKGAVDGDGIGDGFDGRITPTADSHSNPSLASSSSSNIASPNPTTISLLSSSNSTNPPPTSASSSNMAEIGLGSLQCEDQLKSALQSKDRMFLLVLSKEIESFINKLSTGQISQESQPSEAQTQTQTQIPMVQLNASTTIGVTPTSKFQRMLVYKTAEWYGLKAVPGQDGGMIVGLLGEFNEKSTSLKLSELVPPAPSSSSQTQKFRIMQRAPNRNGEASGSSSPAEGSSSSGTKWKTLEEREAAYAAAREKIYGTSTETGTSEITNEAIETLQNAQPPSQVDDEIDPVPRQLYQPFEVVYPSLYHPPKAEPPAPQPMSNASTSTNQYQSQSSNVYGYQSSYGSYSQQIDANGYPIMPQAYGSSQPISPQQPQQNYGIMPQTYMDPSQNGYMMPSQQNGYPVPAGWHQIPQQSNGYPNQMLGPNQQSYGMIPQQQNGINVPQGWQYPPPNQMMSNPPQQQQQQQMMPMISQGVPYPTSYGYPPQTAQPQPQPPIPPYRQGSYPSLVQPTPVRPPMQPHSSASSSISSRSYQDGSRPHSRGSTTSTRSAASSVRLGAMYPATQGPGYRQRAMKGQGMNGLTSLGLGNGSASGMENKRNRGQSPSSTTTTSSRSSRRTSFIQLAPPTSAQHQLPQRPDWAANNVPYHPTPLPDPITPNAAEFPPLLRQDQGTNAEPMQVERAKMKPVGNGGGSVWNGTMVKNIHHLHQSPPHLQGNDQQQQQTRMTIVPPPTRTPLPTQQPKQDVPGSGTDPDFPRRLPTKTQPILYDPSSTSSSGAQDSRPSSVNTHKSSHAQALSPEEIIEAKLAQISINNGIPIGSAPTSSRGGDGKSYAKVVRRD